ncbi:MAG: hypothetical protein QOD71_2469 [Thermoleophilaceae bacterium]|jgi:hypothetical protein|nr:hypothetical protein [Thermoleophilaceae bacterium]
MPSELNRRTVFAAAAAFLAALAVAYGLSSTGEASQGAGPPGSPAEPLDVASGVEGQSTLGEAEALPGLVVRPKPKPAKSPPAQNVAAPTAPANPAPSNPAPSNPGPVYVAPPPPPAQPPIRFSDSG